MKTFQDYEKLEKKYILPTYSRYPVLFVKGKGTKLWDIEGREYLDFIGGLGVCVVGHSHPRLVKAITQQAQNLMQVSNLYYTIPQIELGKVLSELSIRGKCFFTNSGVEANEGAVKLARKFAKTSMEVDKFEVITAYRSFHGRTFEMLSATGQAEKKKDFEPLPPGFKHVPLNDIKALKKAISKNTLAIMLEPIQGEGGIYPCSLEYLREVRKICNEEGLLLILDEVQTGMGRTGKMFGYENYGIEPDIITLAKGLGGGLPIGAFIAKNEIAKAFEPGDHGSTFGGNPLVCSGALETVKIIIDENLVENCAKVGNYFKIELEKVAKEATLIKEIRAHGLMIGVEFSEEIAWEIVLKFLKRGITCGNIGRKIIRFLPPLCINYQEVDTVITEFKSILKESEVSC